MEGMMFEWVPTERRKGVEVAPTMMLWRCDREGCGGVLTFNVEKIKEMKVGENISCVNSFYGMCNESVNATELKKFIGYGEAVAYGNRASSPLPTPKEGEKAVPF